MRWARIGFWICFCVNAMCLIAIGEQYGRLACWLAATVSFVAYAAAMLAAAANEQQRQERIRDAAVSSYDPLLGAMRDMTPAERKELARRFNVFDPREHMDR